MCGITGIFDINQPLEIPESVIKGMNERLDHRGPDGTGYYYDSGIALGHKRLSIIDVASGHQPMQNRQGDLTVVFNGEIYNHRALRDTLVGLGYSFKTQSDTEVLLHGYAAWGEKLPEKLRGMFAFCIYDKCHQTVFLARDRLGIKPLFYTVTSQGQFVFASELKALQAYPQFKQPINPRAVADYFTLGYVPDPHCIFESVHKLSPAETLRVERGDRKPHKKIFWQLPNRSNFIENESEALDSLRAKIEESVDIRLMSEVPLGAFLSGGVDSSVVVATLSSMLNHPLTTCSIGFDENAFDESQYSAAVAKQYKTRHYCDRVPIYQPNLIHLLGRIYDEPFADSSSLPTLKVCEAAKKHVTVVLSGDGGDEVFAGYRRYRGHLLEERLRNTLPYGLRRPLFGALAALYPHFKRGPRLFRAKATFQMLRYQALEGYLNNVAIFKEHEKNRLFSNEFIRGLQGYHTLESFEHHAAQVPDEHPLTLVQYLDLKTYLPGDILTKVDRASMHHSLEVRVPLLDHHLVEWAFSLSPNLKLHGNIGKYLLKKAYESKLSNEILYRKKQGFAVPLGRWFKGPLKQSALSLMDSEMLKATGWFNMSEVGDLVSQHLEGRADHSAKLWSLCMFENFLQRSLMDLNEGEEYAHIACA